MAWGRKKEKRLDLESYDQALIALEARAEKVVLDLRRATTAAVRATNEARSAMEQLRSETRKSRGGKL